MVRVKQCCCGCTLDIGARIVIWADMIATFVVGLSVLANSGYSRDSLWMLSAILIPIKLVILVVAVIGVNKKKASYVHPYVIYNVLAVITMGFLIVVAIVKFDEIVDSDLMKYMMGGWTTVNQQHNREFLEGYNAGRSYNQAGHDYRQNDVFGQLAEESDPTNPPKVDREVRAVYLIAAIIGGIINFFVWTYLNVVLYSYYQSLREGGNFASIDGVEYFAPTEQTGGKSGAPKGASTQYQLPPSYFATPPYPTQPVIPYSPAPPSYAEAAGPNAYENPSLPQTNP